MPKEIRLNKLLAQRGVCSRRTADTYIDQGRVSVNGHVITTKGTCVETSANITVDGKLLGTTPTPALWILHKPKGYICTHSDPQGRRTIFDLPSVRPLGHVISIGRLDYNTEGLILLTNTPSLAQHLEHPEQQYKRTYRVRVHGYLDKIALEKLEKGVEHKGIHYKPAHIDITQQRGTIHWLSVTITEGKNREVRHLMDVANLSVTRLIRTQFGPYTLGALERGALSSSLKLLKKYSV